MQNFIKIRLFILKILTKNAFLTQIKGHNSVVSEWNYPTCNPILLLSSPIPMSMQSLMKIGKKVLKLEHGNEAQSIFDIH